MKSMIKVLAIAALLLAVFSPQMSARAGGGAGGGGTFQIREKGASVVYFSSEGCLETVMQVFTAENVSKGPSTPKTAATTAFVSIFQFDACTGDVLLDAFGFNTISASELQISKKIESATLNTTVTVTDQVTNNTFDVFVDLTWTGSGPLRKDSTHQHSNTPGCKINFRVKGSFRSAEVSGSVSDGTTDFTQGASLTAEIFSVKVGSLTIGCGT
jgi:hypothetical protein